MIVRTITLIHSEWVAFLIFVIFLTALGVAQDQGYVRWTVGITGYLLLELNLAFLVQRSILYNIGFNEKGTVNSIPRGPSLGYYLKYLFVSAIGIGSGFFVLILTDVTGIVEFENRHGAVLIIIVVTLFAYPASFTFFGSCLAADITGHRSGLIDVFHRQNGRVLRAFGHFFAITLVQTIVGFFLILMLSRLHTSVWFALFPDLVFDVATNIVGASIRLFFASLTFAYAAHLFQEYMDREKLKVAPIAVNGT